MSHAKDSNAQSPNAGESAMEGVVRRVLGATGRIVPETEEEVAWAEAAINESAVVLPSALDTPPSSDPRENKSSTSQPAVDALHTEAGSNLARAARNGKAVPDDVLKKMAQDRAAAEVEEEIDGVG